MVLRDLVCVVGLIASPPSPDEEAYYREDDDDQTDSDAYACRRACGETTAAPGVIVRCGRLSWYRLSGATTGIRLLEAKSALLVDLK